MNSKIRFAVLFAAFLSLSLVATGCATVESGSVGVSKTLGTVDSATKDPGVHFVIPGVNSITPISIKTVALPERFTSLTHDAQKIEITATAAYSINKDKAVQAFVQVGDETQLVKTILEPALLSSVKDVVSRYSMTDIIENQEKVAQEITTEAGNKLSKNNFILFTNFQVTGFILDANVQQAVENKQIALQDLQRKQTELQIAEIESKRLQALNGALSPAILQKLAIEKWNGQSLVPPGTNGGNLILPEAAAKK